jgi:NADPH-dependent 2,4-dienoyl-CoA reductase/sulfur reductase-like enzyme
LLNYKYLIVGCGMTGDAAVRGIRQADPDGSIGMVGAEPHPPYDRPPLSKGLWKGKRLESIWRKAAEQEAILHLGRTVKTLDLAEKRIVDDRGTIYTFKKLLLATGAAPRRLPIDDDLKSTSGAVTTVFEGGKRRILPIDDDRIVYFRSLDDYLRLRTLSERGNRFLVVGGGFIGAELAAALSMEGKQVTMIFPTEAVSSHLFPASLAGFLSRYYREKGVEVLDSEFLDPESLERRDLTLALKTGHGREIVVDGVVAGIGVQPNVELARAAGLKVADGICVDTSLRTSHADVYAAGDVAEFYNPALDQRIRVEHEDNANTMGAMAGRAMAGESVNYDHQPFFYGDLFDLGYEAVGLIDSRLETVEDWKEPYRQGVVYYLREGRVRGVLLWNVWGQVEAARQLIASTNRFAADELRGRIGGWALGSGE